MRYGLLLVAALVLAGCENPNNKSASTTPPVAKAIDDHDHAAHGPHGGHPFSLQGYEGKVEAITNKTNDLVQVFFLNADAKADQPVKAEMVTVKTDKLGGKSFELNPVNPDANGLTAEYSLENKDLKNIAGLSPTLEATIDGKTYSGTMDFHMD